MIITIAVIFVLLATFLLIIFNMYSDYVARREQDARLIAAKARNIIAECEELLLNQAQVHEKNLIKKTKENLRKKSLEYWTEERRKRYMEMGNMFFICRNRM